MLEFEKGDIIFVAPIDALEGSRYVELVKEEYDAHDLENIYNISSRIDGYVNTTTDGTLSWKSVNLLS